MLFRSPSHDGTECWSPEVRGQQKRSCMDRPVFPQPHTARKPFTCISQVRAVSRSHPLSQQHRGVASNAPAPCSRAQHSPVLLGGGCCPPFPACDPLPGPAVPSEARGGKHMCSYCRFWHNKQSQGGQPRSCQP